MLLPLLDWTYYQKLQTTSVNIFIHRDLGLVSFLHVMVACPSVDCKHAPPYTTLCTCGVKQHARESTAIHGQQQSLFYTAHLGLKQGALEHVLIASASAYKATCISAADSDTGRYLVV